MTQPDPGSIWGVVRAWADAAGLLLPQEEAGGEHRRVPPSVCDNCPICQAAATLDQVNPQAVIELAEMARSVLTGMGSALASAAEQRLATATSRHAEAAGVGDDDWQWVDGPDGSGAAEAPDDAGAPEPSEPDAP